MLSMLGMLFKYVPSSSYYCLVVLSLIIASPSWGQDQRALTIIVPYATGGTNDIVARQLSRDLGLTLNKSTIVDNKGGAGGTIGVAALVNALPDGNTIMVNHMGITFDDALYKNLSYNTLKDVLPIAYIGVTPNVLVITNKLPINNVKEFIAYAKENPGTLNYGSGGVGSAGHIAMESFMAAAGIKLTHVPYKGSGPAIVDLMSGQIQTMLLTMAAIKPYIDNAQVKALATSGLKRSAALPNLQTLSEAGLKDFNFAPWFGVFAPAKTPNHIVNQLHTAINTTIQNPNNKIKLAQQGLEVVVLSRSEFQTIFESDIERWGTIIRQLKIGN